MSEAKQITKLGNRLKVLAPGKINLTLLVAFKRPDGFHELETIMSKINFYDEILIERGEKEDIKLICQGPEWSPEGEDNLVYKACKLLFENCGKSFDIKITLNKNIPAGSGLGSASSDAAATLIGVNKFLQLGFSNDRLVEMASELGSDVAFFLGGPQAICSGKGEKIKKIEKIFNFSALLIVPAINVSTKKVYENYAHNKEEFQDLKGQINNHIEKNRIDLAAKMCANMLQTSCFDLYRELAELKAEIESLGIRPLCLSGSGSAMFHILDNSSGEKATDYRQKLKEIIGCKNIIVTNNRW